MKNTVKFPKGKTKTNENPHFSHQTVTQLNYLFQQIFSFPVPYTLYYLTN